MHIVTLRGEGRVAGALEQALAHAERGVVQEHALDQVRGSGGGRERREPGAGRLDRPHQAGQGSVARVVGERAPLAPERRAMYAPAARMPPNDHGLVREHAREPRAPRERALAGTRWTRAQPRAARRVNARRGVHHEALVGVQRALQAQLQRGVKGALAGVDLAARAVGVFDVALVRPRVAVGCGAGGRVAHELGRATDGERGLDVVGR